eukprot:783060-Amphidinium_carterae.1
MSFWIDFSPQVDDPAPASNLDWTGDAGPDERVLLEDANRSGPEAGQKDTVVSFQDVDRMIKFRMQDLKAELTLLLERLPTTAAEIQGSVELETRVHAAEQQVVRCVQKVEEKIAQPAVQNELEEVKSLVEASLADLHRLDRDQTQLEASMKTVIEVVHNLSLKPHGIELDESVRLEQSQHETRPLSGSADMCSIISLDKRVQAGEEQLAHAVDEWKLAMAGIEEKLLGHRRVKEAMNGDAVTCSSTIFAAQSLYQQLMRPPSASRARKAAGDKPTALIGEVKKADVTSAADPLLHSVETAAVHMSEGPVRFSSETSEGKEMEAHLLSVIASLQAEVHRLREEQRMSSARLCANTTRQPVGPLAFVSAALAVSPVNRLHEHGPLRTLQQQACAFGAVAQA